MEAPAIKNMKSIILIALIEFVALGISAADLEMTLDVTYAPDYTQCRKAEPVTLNFSERLVLPSLFLLNTEGKTEPNQAPETTILTVTDRAPSSTLHASEDRVSP